MEATYQVSSRTLTKATLSAAIAAAVILALFVLPAERGIDITGLGQAIGLTRMAQPAEAQVTVSSVNPSAANDLPIPDKQSIVKTSPYRADEMTLTLQPNEGVEIKAQMLAGDHYVFRWQSSGPLTVDMHGEKPHAGKAFTRYWKAADQTSAQGSFTAPFNGTHGWYWRNRGEEPVTITVKTDGFYERLFNPGT